MTWSYTRQVKSELAQTPLGALPRCWAELWGLSGQIDDPYEANEPWVRGGMALVIRRGFRLMKEVQLEPKVRLERHTRRVEFSLWGNDVPPPDIEQSLLNCPADWLRGAFLMRGYVSEIDRPVHWEIAAPSGEWGDLIFLAMQRVGVLPHVSKRRGQPILYLKDRERAVYLLGRMGAHQSVLAMQSESVVRDMKNQVNRLVNSETANMKRIVDSALRDARAMSRLAASGRLRTLSPEIRELADLRLKHPDWSFEELGRHTHPPISKSAVNHRLRRLRKWLQRELENR